MTTKRAGDDVTSKQQITAISVRWSRKKRDPGQTWRAWVDHGVGFTGYRLAWFYIGVERG